MRIDLLEIIFILIIGVTSYFVLREVVKGIIAKMFDIEKKSDTNTALGSFLNTVILLTVILMTAFLILDSMFNFDAMFASVSIGSIFVLVGFLLSGRNEYSPWSSAWRFMLANPVIKNQTLWIHGFEDKHEVKFFGLNSIYEAIFLTRDSTFLTIPIPVFNKTSYEAISENIDYKGSKRRVNFAIPFNQNHELIRDTLIECLYINVGKNKHILENIASDPSDEVTKPSIHFYPDYDKGVEMAELRFWIDDAEAGFGVTSDVFVRGCTLLNKVGIPIVSNGTHWYETPQIAEYKHDEVMDNFIPVKIIKRESVKKRDADAFGLRIPKRLTRDDIKRQSYSPEHASELQTAEQEEQPKADNFVPKDKENTDGPTKT